MENAFKIVLGLLFLIAGVYGLIYWFSDFLTIIKGSIGIGIGLIGLLFIILGVSELKD